MITEKDWVLRLAQQIAQLIARALGLARAGKHAEAEAELARAAGNGLGAELSALLCLDAAGAVALLGSAAKVSTFARLVEALAEVRELAGDADGGLAKRLHAADVWTQACARFPNEPGLVDGLRQCQLAVDAVLARRAPPA